jgi:hypothetical protein
MMPRPPRSVPFRDTTPDFSLHGRTEDAIKDDPISIPVKLVRSRGAGRTRIGLVVRLSDSQRQPVKRDVALEAINRALNAMKRAGGKFGPLTTEARKNPKDGETYLFGFVDQLGLTSKHRSIRSF